MSLGLGKEGAEESFGSCFSIVRGSILYTGDETEHANECCNTKTRSK